MPIPWFHQALLPPPSPPLAITANDDDDVDPDNKLPCLLGLREAPWPGLSFRSGASRRVTLCSSETLILPTDQPTHPLMLALWNHHQPPTSSALQGNTGECTEAAQRPAKSSVQCPVPRCARLGPQGAKAVYCATTRTRTWVGAGCKVPAFIMRPGVERFPVPTHPRAICCWGLGG